MKVSDISLQVKNPDRVNVSIDGKYRFSLDLHQVAELGIKVGKEYSDQELADIEDESEYGKLYARTLEYIFLRPHSSREIKDYLWRKTRTKNFRGRDGQVRQRKGVSQLNADRVFARLVEKGYIDDEKFTLYWVENRNQARGISRRKLIAELRQKGVDQSIISSALDDSNRSDQEELLKMIEKKRTKYSDEQKLIAYLARQGFAYDDIKNALSTLNS